MRCGWLGLFRDIAAVIAVVAAGIAGAVDTVGAVAVRRKEVRRKGLDHCELDTREKWSVVGIVVVVDVDLKITQHIFSWKRFAPKKSNLYTLWIRCVVSLRILRWLSSLRGIPSRHAAIWLWLGGAAVSICWLRWVRHR